MPTCELRRNSVSVTKSVKPASLRNWSVDFTINPDPGDGPATKTATKAIPTVSWGNLVSDTLYTVTETTPTGWLNGLMTCSTAIAPLAGPARAPHPRQAAPPGQVLFTPSGNPVTCTVENIAPPRVLVQKRTIGAFGGPFQFDVGNGALVPLTFGTVGITTTEADLDQRVIPEEVVVALGPVTVSETVIPLGFERDTLVCNQFDADGVTVALNTDVAEVDGESSISVASMAQGHELRCVATNRMQELPSTGADPFELTGLGLVLVGAGAISHRLGRRRRPARA